MRAIALVAVLLVSAGTSAAAIPRGCTFYPGAYHCVAEESDGCHGFTALGAGASGVAGAAASGNGGCGRDEISATASVGVHGANVYWYGDGVGCAITLYAYFVGTTSVPCGEAAPPNPGWGSVLP